MNNNESLIFTPTRKKNSYKFRFILFFIFLCFIAWLLSNPRKNDAPLYTGSVKIEAVTGLEDINKPLKLIKTPDGQWYTIKYGPTIEENLFYKINDTIAVPAPDVDKEFLYKSPQKSLNIKRGSGESYTAEDKLGNIYSLYAKSGAPIWKCTLSKIEKDTFVVVLEGLNGNAGCADIYTDMKGNWIVTAINWGLLGPKTEVYKLVGKEAFYIKDFEKFKFIEFYYNDKENFWYMTTTDIKGDNRLFKVTF